MNFFVEIDILQKNSGTLRTSIADTNSQATTQPFPDSKQPPQVNNHHTSLEMPANVQKVQGTQPNGKIMSQMLKENLGQLFLSKGNFQPRIPDG